MALDPPEVGAAVVAAESHQLGLGSRCPWLWRVSLGCHWYLRTVVWEAAVVGWTSDGDGPWGFLGPVDQELASCP